MIENVMLFTLEYCMLYIYICIRIRVSVYIDAYSDCTANAKAMIWGHDMKCYIKVQLLIVSQRKYVNNDKYYVITWFRVTCLVPYLVIVYIHRLQLYYILYSCNSLRNIFRGSWGEHRPNNQVCTSIVVIFYINSCGNSDYNPVVYRAEGDSTM